MAVDYGIEVLVAAAVSADRKAEIVRRLLQVLSGYTRTVTYAATYVAGSESTNEVTITVGGASPNLGIRVVFEEAVVGADKVPEIVRKVIQCLQTEVLTIAHTAAYAEGDRVYNVTITLT